MRLLVALLVLAAAPVYGWDNGGHEMVDAIACAHLNAKAKQAVDQLAAQVHSSRGAYDATTLGCWMDDIRDDPGVPDDQKFRTWHYIDIPIDLSAPKPSFEPGTDDALHGNAVQALKRAVAVLKGGTDPYIKDQPTALAIVMHLVGDIHQPLHCATNTILVHGNPIDDRGGNLELVSNGPPGVAKFPLHRFWDEAYRATFDEDTGCVGTHGLPATPEKFRLLGESLDQLVAPSLADEHPDDFSGWAQESNDLARNVVYPGVTATDSAKRCRLSSAYVLRANYLARHQLVLAGRRLAELLNETLGK